jgi:hypothetical protein
MLPIFGRLDPVAFKRMSHQHLADLRSHLAHRRWRIVRQLPGDDRAVSAIWEISPAGPTTLLHLAFEGLHENGVLPVEHAYGCRLREEPTICAYFARVGRSWPKELEAFLDKLDAFLRR